LWKEERLERVHLVSQGSMKRMPTAEEVAQTRAGEAGIRLVPLGEAQKEATEKLGQGWALADEPCPISSFPLLKDPKTGKLWSVRCQLFIADGEPQQQSPSSTSAASNGGLMSLSTSDAISKKISEKLLEGWTLLEQECPATHACPLLLDPLSKRKWSAALESFIDDPIGEQPAQEDPSPSISCPSTGQDRDIDKISNKIGQKLLQGWIMLDEECPVTHICPLMQDPVTKRKWSAATEGFVDEYIEKRKQSIDEARKETKEEAQFVEMPSPIIPIPEEQEMETFVIGNWKKDAKEKLAEDLKGLEDEEDHLSTKSVESGVSVNGDTPKELERAYATVRSKLREAQRALSKIEVTHASAQEQIERCEALVRLVQTCSRTLSGLPR